MVLKIEFEYRYTNPTAKEVMLSAQLEGFILHARCNRRGESSQWIHST
jgi:hypothetical protein